jgi:hypothetical protein
MRVLENGDVEEKMKVTRYRNIKYVALTLMTLGLKIYKLGV